MAESKRKGKRTYVFESAPHVCCAASIVGDCEGEGPLGNSFDKVLRDDTWGESSWEKAESKMFREAVRMAARKIGRETSGIDCLLGGDLLNQIITANYAARELRIPFFGLYSACSTMTESLLLGSMLVDGGFLNNAACIAASHFSTAERQYRYPLEMGTTGSPTSQRTVTGAGTAILCGRRDLLENSPLRHVCITGGTVGCVIDMGITDTTNMGAAMAPAACDTIVAHLKESGRDVTDYDAIVTGDLGIFGSEMLLELCIDEGLDIEDRHMDCGCLIYDPAQKLSESGASGCGCPAVVFAAHLLPLLESGAWKRVLFLATGALMSPLASQQGESIPGIAHAVVLERTEG